MTQKTKNILQVAIPVVMAIVAALLAWGDAKAAIMLNSQRIEAFKEFQGDRYDRIIERLDRIERKVDHLRQEDG